MENEKDTTQQETGEDVEAHVIRPKGAPAEVADVEAHSARVKARHEDGPPSKETEREQPVADEDDDVEGHVARSGR
jgi:hypothetical protein